MRASGSYSPFWGYWCLLFRVGDAWDAWGIMASGCRVPGLWRASVFEGFWDTDLYLQPMWNHTQKTKQEDVYDYITHNAGPAISNFGSLDGDFEFRV